MKTFFKKWFWEGHRKWLTLFSVVSLVLLYIAYLSVYQLNTLFCLNESDQSCIDFWLHNIGKPLYGGDLLKAMAVAPLLVLPFSVLVFKAWGIMSIAFLSFAFYSIFTTPVYGSWFGKVELSNVFGMIYLALTVLIIVAVSLWEWWYKRHRKTP